MLSNTDHRAWQHLIESEAYRRILSGQAPESFSEFVAQLLDWFTETHPNSSQVTLSAVEESIRATWQRRHELIRGE